MDLKEYRALKSAPKKNKYKNVPIIVFDDQKKIRFDSKAEARRWGELKLLERQGLITSLLLQPRFAFSKVIFDSGRICEYRADFSYTDVNTGALVVEDVKSKATKTDVYKIKKALMRAYHEVDVIEVMY